MVRFGWEVFPSFAWKSLVREKFSRRMSSMVDIDALDRKILNELQRDCSESLEELGTRIGLSRNACWRRIKRMEEMGIIDARVTLLDRELLGLDFEVFVAVKLSLPNRVNMEKFEREQNTPEAGVPMFIM